MSPAATGTTAATSATSAGDLILSARDLAKSYGKTAALRGVSVDIRRGEVLAIMGPSGSGKSTLLHALAGIELPDSGTVTYFGPTPVDSRIAPADRRGAPDSSPARQLTPQRGAPAPETHPRELTALSDNDRTRLRREDFGFVFQFSQLVPELTALDNIAVPLLLGGTKKRAAYATAYRWLERVGLADHAKSLPGEMSGGEAQRIAIARALSPHPSILFADEPTGSLDSLNSEYVMSGLVQLAREHAMTVVLVTHEPTIAAYADREIIVRDGILEA
ncbi:ABC transporter ATP-binding protein [Actinotignum schaalii]|uniref:ABC transporter ATP-binding protein n=1 Tax=Actinotignum schaalii TaxID=59505 RepID=UPI0004D1685C|nr:ABC transporter ATP-binding protein [Actinotignum schaalii]AIE82749.1 macrolide ABC transporter ATP-binding protein [Actinotignum schaalii]WQN45995.1 ABC transporter ATP-binding protein [Actinotignum schaalii]